MMRAGSSRRESSSAANGGNKRTMPISKGETINVGECVEVYLGGDGLVIWYRNPEPGPEWPSMSYLLIVGQT